MQVPVAYICGFKFGFDFFKNILYVCFFFIFWVFFKVNSGVFLHNRLATLLAARSEVLNSHSVTGAVLPQLGFSVACKRRSSVGADL